MPRNPGPTDDRRWRSIKCYVKYWSIKCYVKYWGHRRCEARAAEGIMALKAQDTEFRHQDTVAYLRERLTDEEAAKQPPLIRECDGVFMQQGREGGRVCCREVKPQVVVAIHRPVVGIRQGRRPERNIMAEIQKVYSVWQKRRRFSRTPGLPGGFRSAFSRGSKAGSAPGPKFPRFPRFFVPSAQAPPSAAFRPAGFRGKRRSGGALSSDWLQPLLAFPPHPPAFQLRPPALFPPPFAFQLHPLALAQDLPGPVDVEGEDGEADRPLESVRAAQPDPVQTAVL